MDFKQTTADLGVVRSVAFHEPTSVWTLSKPRLTWVWSGVLHFMSPQVCGLSVTTADLGMVRSAAFHELASVWTFSKPRLTWVWSGVLQFTVSVWTVSKPRLTWVWSGVLMLCMRCPGFHPWSLAWGLQRAGFSYTLLVAGYQSSTVATGYKSL